MIAIEDRYQYGCVEVGVHLLLTQVLCVAVGEDRLGHVVGRRGGKRLTCWNTRTPLSLVKGGGALGQAEGDLLAREFQFENASWLQVQLIPQRFRNDRAPALSRVSRVFILK